MFMLPFLCRGCASGHFTWDLFSGLSGSTLGVSEGGDLEETLHYCLS